MNKTPTIVLTYNGWLIDDDSDLLENQEWLKQVIGSKGEDGEALLHLQVRPYLTNQAAINYIKKRRVKND